MQVRRIWLAVGLIAILTGLDLALVPAHGEEISRAQSLFFKIVIPENAPLRLGTDKPGVERLGHVELARGGSLIYLRDKFGGGLQKQTRVGFDGPMTLIVAP